MGGRSAGESSASDVGRRVEERVTPREAREKKARVPVQNGKR